MKQKKQIVNNRILKAVVLICFLVVAGVSVFAGGYLYLSDKEADKQTEEAIAAKDEAITKEAGAVMAQKKFFGQSFSDESDGKKAIRVVEVIPHEICSVFPYMVDWKDVKSYDEKTFLGYDGLRYLTVKATAGGKNRHQFSLTKDGITRDYLDNYNVNFIQEGNWSWDIGIWRATEMDSDILGANGYFEYVENGNAKGLYSINLDKIVKNSDKTAYGIRYDVMAMKRQGAQPKQGEWEVKNERYYWAKDYAETTNYPTGEVHQHTGFNYDLKFKPDASGDYRVKEVKLPDSKPVNTGYEYVAELAAGVDWSGGYIYSKNGNYKVSSKSSTKVIDPDTADLTGKYIRISNDNIDDGSGLPGGYFRLCTSEDNIQAGDTVYSVTFSAVAGGGQGSYILNPAEVHSKIELDRSQALKDILFQYAGENKGNYDVAFIYSESVSEGGASYCCELAQVSNGDGRYALTSTEESVDDLYEKVGSGHGDYSKVVTSIDCAGIDYKEYKINESYSINTIGYYDNTPLPGLTTGCDPWGGEYGNWVFHPIDSDKVNGITKIEEFENGQIPKRIYVYGQNRKNRFYAQNGFENNEWFKLLLYLSTEDESRPLAYDDYANGTLTPLEIKAKYEKDIEAFDRAYRIEIVQRTPEELTKSDVEKADLIYFGNSIGLPGLNETVWNDLINTYGIDLPSYTSDSLKYTSDLSADALMAIYDNCLYERTTALLFSAECIDEYSGDGSNVDTNLGKLGFLTNLFKDPSDFAYFIEGYPEKNEDYSTIHKDNADVSAYRQTIGGGSGIGTVYNMGTKIIAGDGTTQTGDEIPPYRSNVWKKEYFRVVEITLSESGVWELNSEYFNGDGKYGDNWGAHSWWNFTGKDVLANDITWYIPRLTSDIFDGFLNTRNVWKILKNKKSKEVSEPVIVVTNADGSNISEIESVTPVYYYYVDAFAYGGGNSDFDIDFRVNWRPEEITQPTALKKVTVTRENGSVVFNQDSPKYKTDYTCNVAGDFIKDGVFDSDITSKEYTITAVDAADKTDTVIVRFMVRDSFMLN